MIYEMFRFRKKSTSQSSFQISSTRLSGNSNKKINLHVLRKRFNSLSIILFPFIIIIALSNVTFRGYKTFDNDEKISVSNDKMTNISKPVFILHVGPPKTGSTTLQCTLERLRQALEKDNIVYIGRPECQDLKIDIDHKRTFKLFENALVNGFNCHKELIDMEKSNMENMYDSNMDVLISFPSCWNEFLQQLEKYFIDGKNVIFSDEAMSNRIALSRQYKPNIPYPWKSLKSALETMKWNVKVLIVHRPLYDYLPSVYIDQFKYGHGKIRLQRWFNTGKDGDKCPSQNGREIPRPFQTEGNEITIARLLKTGQNLYPTPAQIYQIVQNHGLQLILVDMMSKPNGKDFIERIICDKFPGTGHTCNELGDHKKSTNTKMEQDDSSSNISKSERWNKSPSLFYDFVAVQACQKGLIDGNTISRVLAQRAIESRLENELNLSPNDFPLECPNDHVMENILNKSIEHERIIRNHNCQTNDCDEYHWNLNEETRHKEQFWDTVRTKKKFCTVDSKRVIADIEWVNFFRAIKT